MKPESEGTLLLGRQVRDAIDRVRLGAAAAGTVGLARLRQVVGDGGERGDVPGWVMIAVMTAALVMAILVPFRNTIIPAMTSAIQDMFGQAS
jgi:hypothetical protein